MNLAIIGTGYVGLTTATTFAYLGHDVRCLDIDAKKIESIRAGHAPFFEPHLDEVLAQCAHRMRFTTDAKQALEGADVIFIAVGTPASPDGSPDLSFVRSATEQIGLYLSDKLTVIVNKSTVPIGSGDWVATVVRDVLAQRGDARAKFAVASNPEFLREGSAVADSLYPDRIVVGTDNADALEILRNLYDPLVKQSFESPPGVPRPGPDDWKRAVDGSVPFVVASIASAEMIKYAANAFLALKISFINELAELSEKVGANIKHVAHGIGLDQRIGPRFLQAGLGWGGSCFGKDTSALIATGRDYDVEMRIVQAARDVNEHQRERLVDAVVERIGPLGKKTIGLLGLAFKPQTDDLRDAPATDLIKRFWRKGAKIKAHDPVAMTRAKRELTGLGVQFCESIDEVFEGADAVILATEWTQYRKLPWDSLGAKMHQKLLFDGRNVLSREALERAGFQYFGMGC